MATDYDCWRDHGDSVSVTDVLATFKKNAEKVTAMFREAVPFIASQGHWDDVIDKLKVQLLFFKQWDQIILFSFFQSTVECSIMKPNH